jgi:hypothetical protein
MGIFDQIQEVFFRVSLSKLQLKNARFGDTTVQMHLAGKLKTVLRAMDMVTVFVAKW